MKFSWIRLFLCLFLFGVSPIVLAEEEPNSSCLQTLLTDEQKSELIDQVFKDSFFKPNVYKCYYCNRNVVRLFQQIKLAHPKIKAEDMQVLYITTKSNVAALKTKNNLITVRNFQVKNARDGYVDGRRQEFISFPFHVVLEFNGRIYDLDYTDQPTPVSAREYLDEFFLNDNYLNKQKVNQMGIHDDMVVYAVPGLRYLTTPEEFTLRMWFHLSIFARFEPEPLVDYLSR